MQKNDAINGLVENMFFDNRESAIKAVNESLIKAAQTTGASLYDICLRTIPVISTRMEDTDDRHSLIYEVRLQPIQFDFTHDGGYWKERYYNLKNKMQELIDNKDN